MSASLAPSARYQAGVEAGRWQDDPAQRAILDELDRIHHGIRQTRPASLLTRLGLRSAEAVQGLYLWGKVGRGKTFLTDLLVESLPQEAVKRSHFHRFMRDVHAQLRQLGHISDPLPVIAERMAEDARLLCLDEFQVIDIGDAMLLGGLLTSLFGRGVCLVTTSNTAPHELYRDGLQRARFEPAIAQIEAHCRVHEMISPHDWRLRALERLPCWLTPPGRHADRVLADAVQSLADGPVQSAGALSVNQRQIPVRQHADGVAWFDFEALCEGPRAASDYLELASRFPALLVSGVPQFNPDHENAARRFVHLVDALYDQHVHVLMSAMVPIVDLYDGNRLRAEFARTESRLIEMQSREYRRHPE
ncbi:MAG: cell division protein ZapE [Rhodanobacteraceae bacterium]